MNEDIMSLTMVMHGGFVACGTQEGIIYLFKWGKFNDAADRILVGESVDTMVKYDENKLIIGGYDGMLKQVGLYPNKVLWTEKSDTELHNANKLALSSNKELLGIATIDS